MKRALRIWLALLFSAGFLIQCDGNGGGDNKPKSTTQDASDVTLSTATLNGQVIPNGLDTQCWFEYGESAADLSSSTAQESISAEESPHQHADTITGLEAGTKYYFRMVSENSDGVSYGGIQYFTTNTELPPPQAGICPEATGCNELGRGYDVFHPYANIQYVRNKVLDVNALDKDEMLYQPPINRTEIDYISGTSLESYANSFSQKLKIEGQYKVFSGSVDTNFKSSESINTESSFATVWVKELAGGLRLEYVADETELRQYMLENAKSDIDGNITPEQIFATYGTHVIANLVVGGRVDYNLTANVANRTDKTEFGLYAEAKLDMGSASISLESDTDWAESYSERISNEHLWITAVGGQWTAVGIWQENNYTAWAQNVWNNPEFCDFGEEPWLIPIWHLAPGAFYDEAAPYKYSCEPDSRCEQIRKAYETYAEGKTYNIPEAAPRWVLTGLAALKTTSYAPGDFANDDGDYKKMFNHYINWKTGGNYCVWLYGLFEEEYKDVDREIRYISSRMSWNSFNPEDAGSKGMESVKDVEWLTTNIDMNVGAGGPFIFLMTGDAVWNETSGKLFPTDQERNVADGPILALKLSTSGDSSTDYWYQNRGEAKPTVHTISPHSVEAEKAFETKNGWQCYWVDRFGRWSEKQDLNEDAGGSYQYLGFCYADYTKVRRLAY